MPTLRLILGDQLDINHPWFRVADEDHLYVMMEVLPEATYVTHHIQKLLAFFHAMRTFAHSLARSGHRIIYLHLDAPDNLQDFGDNLMMLIRKYNITRLEYMMPDEYRLDEKLSKISGNLSVEVNVYDTNHFLTDRYEVQRFFEGKKTFVMEQFYRYMRRKHGILTEDGKPVTGVWNYDRENRSALKPGIPVPQPLLFSHDVSSLETMIRRMNITTFGQADSRRLIWPADRTEALQLLGFFLDHLLPRFGEFQDAMSVRSWSLFHSRLSFSLNTKMIHPGELVSKVVDHWRNHPEIPFSSVEGFIRQVIGWREFMRGIYWHAMPGYERMNFFGHDRPLPGFYWNGKTRMSCMRHTIEQSLQYAYAHHIQRLMVTGNFALIAGIHPDEVDRWYLGVYIDAVQWVEITNTRGMSQYADGGMIATKPYASSGKYIHRMSDYCSGCHYDVSARDGEFSCPFNSLYWHFLDRHRERTGTHPRMGMMYRTWDSMEGTERRRILRRAEHCLEHLEEL
ncbi:MAG: cryptochrome/photolyase family protein [Bacteroidales bacterium]|nr:cryptochrome/photolyase family protein [Bacteroidales bacterium]